MRFVCDSCRAQYMISDDKVGPKGVKVRCKKCGYVILVRRPDPEAAISNERQHQPPAAIEAEAGGRPPEDEEPTNPGYLSQSNPPGKSVLDGLADDEIGAAFDQALSPGSSAPREDESAQGSPLDPARDRPLETDGRAALKLFEQSVAAAQPAAPVEAQQNGAAHEWFVAINEQQVGPFGFDKVKHLWDRGEIGPDTLCWRAGLSDWVSLAETPELASLLAPKPARPVIVAPTSGVTSGAPVESVFSSGAGSKAARAEALPAAAGAEQSGGWKPSAATALASLMKEEIEVLAKPPAPAPAAEPSGAASRLLDVPAAQSNGRTISSPSLRVSTGESSASRAPAASALAQPTYPSLYAGYPAKSSRKMIVFLSVGAGLLLLALAVVTTILVIKPAEPSGEAVVAVKPKSGGGKTATTAPGQSEPEPRKEGAAASKVDSTAVAKTESSRSLETAKADAPPKVDSAPPPISRTERPSRRERGARSSSRGGGEEISVPAVKRSERPEVVAHGSRSSSDDDAFEKEFGGGRKGGAAKAEPPSRRPSSVYIPPEPGAEIPESLGQSDIMQVVVANKPAILRCVTEQKKKDSNLSGRLVMRWTILASGKTTNISCQSEEFRSSYMAQCLSSLIRGWQFPRHKIQGEAINFPFTF